MAGQGLRYVLSLFSANALQIGFSQLGSFFLFWLSSKELPKEEFGLFNWYFAVYGTISTILTLGFDYIVIRRISAKNDVDAARVQFIQNLCLAIVSLAPVLFLLLTGVAGVNFQKTILVLVAFQFMFLSLPFKNVLTGNEMFIRSARAVIISNGLKIILIIYLYIIQKITLWNVSLVLALSNGIELVSFSLLAKKELSHRLLPELKKGYYVGLIKEALPQLGVLIFDSAFARIDWILLGLLSGAAAAINTAEYSFAYKIFELSKLPLLVLAPILFTRSSKLFSNPDKIGLDSQHGLSAFLKTELLVGMTVPILLNICWIPLMQLFTSGKYGPENAKVYLLLSLTLPFMYLINFLWTIAFAQGQLRLTMNLSILNSLLNIGLNLLLIPSYGQIGAAVAFLVCNILMLPLYLRFVDHTRIKLNIRDAVFMVLSAGLSGAACYFLPFHTLINCVLSVIIYLGITWATGLFGMSDIHRLKLFINKS